jgi:hypothetical protein
MRTRTTSRLWICHYRPVPPGLRERRVVGEYFHPLQAAAADLTDEVVREDCHKQQARIQREQAGKPRRGELAGRPTNSARHEQPTIIVMDDKTAQHEGQRHAVHAHHRKVRSNPLSENRTTQSICPNRIKNAADRLAFDGRTTIPMQQLSQSAAPICLENIG